MNKLLYLAMYLVVSLMSCSGQNSKASFGTVIGISYRINQRICEQTNGDNLLAERTEWFTDGTVLTTCSVDSTKSTSYGTTQKNCVVEAGDGYWEFFNGRAVANNATVVDLLCYNLL